MTDPFALERASIFDPAVIEILSRDDPMAVHKLRAFACPRDDIDESVIDLKELQRGCPLDQTSTASSTGSPGPHWKDTVAFRPLGHFGRLEALPLETLQAILEHLDLQTLTDLRCVSRRAMLVVDSLPLYKEIYSHAPDVLRAMLSTHSARHFDLWLVSRELRAEYCYLCGDFGPFFLLPGCARCCWLCLGKAEDTLPVSKAQAKSPSSLRMKHSRKRPSCAVFPAATDFRQDRELWLGRGL